MLRDKMIRDITIYEDSQVALRTKACQGFAMANSSATEKTHTVIRKEMKDTQASQARC